MYPSGDSRGGPRAATLAGLLVVALLAFLPGCAAALPRSVPAPVVEARTFAVPVSVVRDLAATGYVVRNGRAELVRIPSWGVTSTTPTGEPVDLELEAGMTRWPALLFMVTAHEVGHVLGLLDHDEACPWMRASIPETTALQADPCEDTATRTRARAAGRVVVLILPERADPAFLAALTWAAARWNRILDRPAVLVRTATTPAKEPAPTRPPGGT